MQIGLFFYELYKYRKAKGVVSRNTVYIIFVLQS